MKEMNNFFEYDTKSYPISLDLVDSSVKFKLFVDIINKYHSYKSFKHSPCRNLRWLVYEKSDNLVGAIGLSSAAIGVTCRENYVGWTRETKVKNLNKVAANSRFCLVQERFTIKNVGSMTLKLLASEGAKVWKERYGDQLVLLETFIEASENRIGCVYKASNWLEIGITSGSSISKAPYKLWLGEDGPRGDLARKDKAAAIKKYGKYLGDSGNDSGYKITKTTKKLVFIKPLVKNWKIILNTP